MQNSLRKYPNLQGINVGFCTRTRQLMITRDHLLVSVQCKSVWINWCRIKVQVQLGLLILLASKPSLTRSRPSIFDIMHKEILARTFSQLDWIRIEIQMMSWHYCNTRITHMHVLNKLLEIILCAHTYIYMYTHMLKMFFVFLLRLLISLHFWCRSWAPVDSYKLLLLNCTLWTKTNNSVSRSPEILD